MDLQHVVYAAVIVVNLTVGGRLLWQGRKPGNVPERLLGASLALDGIEWLLWVIAFWPGVEGTRASDAFAYTCRVGIVCHSIFLLAFTRHVFRPQSPAALGLLLGAATVMLGSLGIAAAHGDWSGYGNRGLWIYFETGTQQVAYAWTLLESALHHARMRRRLHHGLGDPVVSNRLALWAIYGGASLAAGLLYVGSVAVATASGSYPFAIDVLMVIGTSIAASMLWLAFFPPAGYRRWVAARVVPAVA